MSIRDELKELVDQYHDAIARNAERRITMTAEPITLLDLALGLMVLIALVAIVVNVIALVKEYIKSQNDRAR